MKGKKLLFGIGCSLFAAMLMPAKVCAKEVMVPICHAHSGTAQTKGGCYTKEVYRTEYYTYKDTHGHRIEANGVCVCGNTGTPGTTCQRIVEKTGTRQVFDHYAADCGISDTDALAYLTLGQSEEEWTKALSLQASYEAASQVFVTDGLSYIWNGEAPSEQSVYEVFENGTYTLQLVGTDIGATAELVIDNIDHTAPVLSEYTCMPQEWTNEEVHITVSAAEDKQEDGTSGCGLAENPFAWNTEDVWGQDGYTAAENGDVVLYLRDRLGNSRQEIISVRNIDKTAPTVENIQVTEGKNLQKCLLTVYAKDCQTDGSPGCGLHETAYSWDNGLTWQESNTHEVTKNGTYPVWVRDRLGNTEKAEAVVNSIDSYGPTVLYENRPSVWTNGEVTVVVTASDRNEDGSEGIGLSENAFSWDFGKTWGMADSYTTAKNGTRIVWLKDRYGNITKQKTTVANIDKTPPVVGIHAGEVRQTEHKTKEIVLTAEASDGESGLDYMPFLWNGGKEWSKENSITVKEAGTYSILVRDKAGNTASCSIYVPPLSETPETFIEETEQEEPETILQEEGVKKSETAKHVGKQTERQSGTGKRIWKMTMPTVLPLSAFNEPGKDNRGDVWKKAHTDMEEAVETPDTPSVPDKVEWLACAGGLVLLVSLLLFLWWFFFTSAEVYTSDVKAREILLGRCMLYKKREGYTLHISKKMYEKSATGEFKIVFAPFFSDAQRGSLLVVKAGEKTVKTVITQKVYVSM